VEPAAFPGFQRMMRLVSSYDETSLNARGNVSQKKERFKPGPRDEKGVLAARLLEAARESFAQRGMAGTTVRAVARSVGVDPALVYHYYRSKDGLLEACTTPPPEFIESVRSIWATPRDQLGVALVENLLRSWNDDRFSPIFRSILLIAAHDAATKDKLRAIIEGSLMGPALGELGEAERATRAGLVASQLLGLAFMRYIWMVEPIASMSEAAVILAVAPNLQRFIDGDVGILTNGSPRKSERR
jgi:AcrR family transcriptional regulator